MTVLSLVALLLVGASAAAAQQPASQKSAASASGQGATEASAITGAKTQGTKATLPGTRSPAARSEGRAPRQGMTVAPETPPPRVPVIMREVFTYDSEGRRDPFVTLLTSEELRPTVADLRLVGVLLDPRRPIAVMREAGTNTQYRVTTGMRIGRMRVAQIKQRSVIFSIEEFGMNRTDSITLGDTTKVRPQ